ncbi:MAG TPA: DUF2336 domain-containing protein [Geminicoccaceae bacterium]|nr:DUF2336 domain-containing protein [Geminicoccaceae bacterium]
MTDLPEEGATAPPPLTRADVEALRGDRSPGSRAAIATKFGAQFDRIAVSGHGELVDAVLWLLVRDVERTVRQALAETVAASPNLPPAAAERLARDAIEVARPILEQSPALRDEALIEIVRTHAMQYALAVAGRAHLSGALSDALADTGQPPVVLRLVGNEGAELSGRTLQRIADDYRDDRTIRERLVERPALPLELVEQLITLVGERLQWQVVCGRTIALAEAQTIMAGARQRAAASWAGGAGPGPRLQEGGFGRRHLAGALAPERALAFLRDGEMGSFEAAMALLAGVTLARARQLLYGPDRRALAALCLRAGFGTPHYVALRMVLELAERCLDSAGRLPPYPRDALEFAQQQYERLRHQPELVATLLGE